MGFWEPEEAVGRGWHRWAGAAESYPHHAQAAVRFEDLRARLAVFYRGLGGAGGVRLAASGPVVSAHRLRLRQRLGLGSAERLERPSFDRETLLLPGRIDCFPERALNIDLYFWLAAFFAHAPELSPRAADPLQADIQALRRVHRTTRRMCRNWPGLAASHATLAGAVRAIRPRRRLAGLEAAIEEVVEHLLGGTGPTSVAGHEILAAVIDGHRNSSVPRAPRGYRPFLPVPLWGVVIERAPPRAGSGDDEPGGAGAEAEERRLRERRRALEQTERKDALVMVRLEHMPMLAETANLNRPVEDDDADGARQAADALDQIAVGSHERQPSTRLKLDLDLAPEAVATGALVGKRAYPERDYTRRCYHHDHCRVFAKTAVENGTDWKPDAAARAGASARSAGNSRRCDPSAACGPRRATAPSST